MMTTLEHAAAPAAVRPPSSDLEGEMLLNRLALQLEHTRYLARQGRVDAGALQQVIGLLKTACRMAFPNPEVWSGLALPPAPSPDGRRTSPAAGVRARRDMLEDASSLLDRAADRLARLGAA